MSEEIEEKIILRNLVLNDDYYNKIIPYISEDLFSEKSSQKIFECIKGYQDRYNKKCTLQVLEVFQNSLKSVNQELYNEITERIDYIRSDTSKQDLQWLIDETVNFIKRKKYYQDLRWLKRYASEKLFWRRVNALPVLFLHGGF